MFYKTILFVHDALGALFIPKWESLANFGLWTNAMGQAFFSISVVAGVMIAYGSYCPYTQGFEILIVGTHKHHNKKEDILNPLVNINAVSQQVLCLPN